MAKCEHCGEPGVYVGDIDAVACNDCLEDFQQDLIDIELTISLN